jgi:O-acetyl-ADP-ribose deacetylase (regulator of RNase III)
MTPVQPLPLLEYRRLVALDEPFVPSVSSEPTPDALLRAALSQLEREVGAGEREPLARAAGNARQRLRALLTVRPPAPLTEEAQAAIDGLLRAERATRQTTYAEALPRFAPGAALWKGDITTLCVDAIVNAANARLLGCFTPFHACIDNAIHAAAGPRLRDDCHRIMTAQKALEPTACAKVTRGYHLPSRFVLHTVGPIVRGALTHEHCEALAQAYRACLEVAVETGSIRSLAFCAISTGVFGFPPEPAARIALSTTRDWLREHPGALDLVVFNVFSDADQATYEDALQELKP